VKSILEEQLGGFEDEKYFCNCGYWPVDFEYLR
jgi:hypothetical protein